MSHSPLPACPPEEVLEQHVSGSYGSAEDAASVQAHIDACQQCGQTVARLREDRNLLDSVGMVLRQEARDTHRAGSSEKPGTASPASTEPIVPPEAIEGYRILEELGRGGMGVVYKAVQLSTKRTVALKVMLDGPFASKTSRRRFEREVELAASLSHPGIVTIHDSGLSHGRYYFAMDLVVGQRLDRHVRDRALSVSERLSLVQKICEAVQYAHQHGVIHRDLKPSNILVDGRGEPRVLDFGLAKMLGSDPSESLQVTVHGQMLGTLAYMAPEQTEGSRQDVDTRTDVYALGLILYELLTGRSPYTVKGPASQVMRNIAEAEPVRPGSVVRGLDRDVETIVLKALAKQKDRRYQSAGDLAADIQRHLADEPIEARQDSLFYVLGKTIHRQRWRLIGVCLLLSALLAPYMVYHTREADRRQRQAQATQLKAVAAALMDAGGYQQAEDAYVKALSLDAADTQAKQGLEQARKAGAIDAFVKRARDHQAHSRYEQAVQVAQEGLAAHPDSRALQDLIRTAKGTTKLFLTFELGAPKRATLRAIATSPTVEQECELSRLLAKEGLDIDPGWQWLTVWYEDASRADRTPQQVRYLLQVQRDTPCTIDARRIAVGVGEGAQVANLSEALKRAVPGCVLALLPGTHDLPADIHLCPNVTICSADPTRQASVNLQAPSSMVSHTYGIVFQNLRIQPAILSRPASTMLQFMYCTACKVLDCTFADRQAAEGSQALSANFDARQCDGIEVAGNVFTAPAGTSIMCIRCRRLVIRRNRIQEVKAREKHIACIGDQGAICVDNIITGAAWHCIDVGSSQGICIACNDIKGTADAGVFLQAAEVLVVFNDIRLSPGNAVCSAISLFGTADDHILHNRLSSPIAGVHIIASSSSIVARNLVTDAAGVLFAAGWGNSLLANVLQTEHPVRSTGIEGFGGSQRPEDTNNLVAVGTPARLVLVNPDGTMRPLPLDGLTDHCGAIARDSETGTVLVDMDGMAFGPAWSLRKTYLRQIDSVASAMLEFDHALPMPLMDGQLGDETIARTRFLLRQISGMPLPAPEGWDDSSSIPELLSPDLSYGAARSPVWVRPAAPRIAWMAGAADSDSGPLAMEISRFGRVLWKAEGLDPKQGTVSIPLSEIQESGPWFQCRLYRVDTGQTVAQIRPIEIKTDTDGDGLDDDWERRYFGNLSQQADGDPDGDGASNLCEYYSMTDPTVPTLCASDMKELYGKVGFGLLEHNTGQSWGGGKILMEGVEWDKSLGAHANSVVEYEVPPGVDAFRAICATWDRNGATVRFECYVNGQIAYRGSVYDQYSYPEFVEVPVKPGDRLKLVVDSVEDINRDHSCWLMPAFVNTALHAGGKPLSE